ncbi:MAG TPA: CHRD domain-containing protein [Steroidobacteraceae bacterium]
MFTPRRALLSLAAAAIALTAFNSQAAEETFRAKLTGAAQLPDPTDSKATGNLELTVSADGKSVTYKLTVENLNNASGADVHLGPATMNGPLVVKLFPKAGQEAKKGPFSGVLAEGSFSARDLLGSMAGGPLSDFIDELRAGNVYTNVHTNDGQDPPNSGPGDYRNGEIRGQLK